MRRAFTLIELLVVVAIIATMTSVAVVSVRTGQDAARLKGSVRDAFATIRHARSMALVSKQPSIITYSTVQEDGENCARITVHTAKLISGSQVTTAETLEGETVRIGGDDEEKNGDIRADDAEGPAEGQGDTVGDFLFEPADSDVFHGISIKVIKEGDELADFDQERAKPKISVFSNVDYLLGRFNQDQEKKTAAGKTSDADASAVVSGGNREGQSEVSFVWEVNGRTEPHKVWFYRDGTRYDEGLCISIDRFGAAKVLGSGEEDE